MYILKIAEANKIYNGKTIHGLKNNKSGLYTASDHDALQKIYPTAKDINIKNSYDNMKDQSNNIYVGLRNNKPLNLKKFNIFNN